MPAAQSEFLQQNSKRASSLLNKLGPYAQPEHKRDPSPKMNKSPWWEDSQTQRRSQSQSTSQCSPKQFKHQPTPACASKGTGCDGKWRHDRYGSCGGTNSSPEQRQLGGRGYKRGYNLRRRPRTG